LRCNFLANTTDLIPLRGGGGAQFTRQFSRLTVQAGKSIVWEIYFHALHAARLAILMDDRKSSSARLAWQAKMLRKQMSAVPERAWQRGSRLAMLLSMSSLNPVEFPLLVTRQWLPALD